MPFKDAPYRRARVECVWIATRAATVPDWVPPVKPKRIPNTARNKARALVAAHPEIYIDDSEWRNNPRRLWVYCEMLEAAGDDPFMDEGHFCDDWDEALRRVETYVDVLAS